ncbi:MAG: hypothetical protein JOZ62_21440 [Acidobacteriaceae bacterium]|nr:hypothetical protein [Acidobacteriaceae bacterium]
MKLLFTGILIIVASLAAQQRTASGERPPLFFREDWKQTPAVTPITQNEVSNSDLLIGLYGEGRDKIRKSHHDHPADDPFYVWSGLCKGNWAVTLRKKEAYVDLTGLAKLRWRTKQTGLRQLHVILKLADGTWLVSDQAIGPMSDWEESDLTIADLRWHTLDMKTITENKVANTPNLSKVDEIGWTDLMTGGGTPASSRVDWIEVYGWAVKR